MTKFYPLEVLDVRPLTDASVEVSFDVPFPLRSVFSYKAGQYLTLKFELNGSEVRRSYSLCSTPALNEPLRIGVKRVTNGLISNHINNNVRPGDTIEVMAPDGRFAADVKPENYKTYYLFAAGSGITPIISILRTVLLTEERSFVHMIYGNTSMDSIMFNDELKQLQQDHFDRFVLKHVLSRPKSSWSDLWSSGKKSNYRKGRIDSECVRWFINEYPPYAQNAEYYVCGPGTMIENVKTALKDLDVPDDRIFSEHFGGGSGDETIAGVENARLHAFLRGEKLEINIPKGKTILRALIDAEKEPPYSCEGGVCATCLCTLKKGKVHMRNNLALDEKEVAQGLILSCQSIPLTEELEIHYPQ